MGKKVKRLMTIMKIIENQKIDSQEELLKKLEEQGFILTQATLSRDLKFLKVGKVADGEGGYIYISPENTYKTDSKIAQKIFPVNGFLSLEFSNNLAVIKTLPGYASSIASTIDTFSLYEILGTIAGDDTILVIPREEVSSHDIINALVLKIPEIKDKI